MGEAVAQIFNAFQDHLNNEQERREVSDRAPDDKKISPQSFEKVMSDIYALRNAGTQWIENRRKNLRLSRSNSLHFAPQFQHLQLSIYRQIHLFAFHKLFSTK